jgi:hypothetical protein
LHWIFIEEYTVKHWIMGKSNHLLAACLEQGPLRLEGITYYLRNGRVCARPSHHRKKKKLSEAERSATGRFTEVRKLWVMFRRALGDLSVWRVAAREEGASQGDTLFHRLNAGCIRSGEGVWCFPAFRFAAGSLDMPALRSAGREGEKVVLEWEVDEDRAGARWSDRVYVGYFHDADPRVPRLVVAEGVCRQDGGAALAIPPAEGVSEGLLHVYLFFGNEEGTRFSPSVYACV